jgi:hypothetical protein
MAQEEIRPLSIKIDKDVPLPNGGPSRYPWDQMKSGDSFYIEGSMALARLQRASGGWRRKHGGEFVVRREGNGARVWRTA